MGLGNSGDSANPALSAESEIDRQQFISEG
jgi:hypothetical protein